MVYKISPTALKLVLCSTVAILSSCTGKDYHDSAIQKQRADFNALMTPPGGYARPTYSAPPPIPSLAQVVQAPVAPTLSPNPYVSVSMTENTPLKDVLFRMAQQAGVEIEIDARIAGGVLFSANHRRFLDVIDQVCSLAGLQYTVKNNVVRISVDTPFEQSYAVPYLAMSRVTNSALSVSGQLGAASSSGGTGGSTGGTSGGSGSSTSSSNVTGTSTSDFYGELQKALTDIISNTQPTGLSAGQGATGSVVIHKQAGIVTVFGTHKQQEAVAKYLRQIMSAVSSEVEIDAKIVEVQLNKQYSSGIDWHAVGGVLSGSINFGTLGALPPYSTLGSGSPNLASFALDARNYGALVSLLEKFGTARTLSSPRITVMNNQTAIMKVAQNAVYFQLNVTKSATTTTTTAGTAVNDLTVNSQIQTIPVGFIMAVQPSIDLRSDTVTMTLRPSVTRITSYVNDPAVSILSNNTVTSPVPVVDSREVDSVLQMRSGQVAVLGGLMQQSTNNTDTGVPGLASIPFIGQAFKARDNNSNMSELVIFLRATIVNNSNVGPADSRLYTGYTNDPRPFPMPKQ